MSSLNDIRNYILYYNGYDVSIETISETHIIIDNEPFKISIVDAYIKEKDKSKIYLGSFFVHLPKVLEQEDEKRLISVLIDNINSVICDRYRYIGTFESNIDDEKVIKELKNTFPKPLEEELKQIYLEFLSIDKEKEPKKYRNYSAFLEFYFYGQDHIPDSIKAEYMKKHKNKSLLDYQEIESDIRSQFKGNEYASHKREKDDIKRKINELDKLSSNAERETYYIEDFIRACDFLYNISDNADNIDCDIKRLETKISKVILDVFKKNKLKKELKTKKNDLKTLSKTENEGTKSLKLDIIRVFPDLKDKISKMTLGKLLNLLKNMKTEREALIKLNSKTRETLESEITNYEEDELDFDYFFQRISVINNKLENRIGHR
jgi:hypothetical protein